MRGGNRPPRGRWHSRYPAVPRSRRANARDCRRKLAIKDLGPRFSALLSKMSPDPRTGNYFPIPYQAVTEHFVIARERAGLKDKFEGVDFHLHDLRGTFAVHRGVVVKTMRQLEVEMGHNDWKSLQSYLDRADQLAPEESIFYASPLPDTAPPTQGSTSGELDYPLSEHPRAILH